MLANLDGNNLWPNWLETRRRTAHAAFLIQKDLDAELFMDLLDAWSSAHKAVEVTQAISTIAAWVWSRPNCRTRAYLPRAKISVFVRCRTAKTINKYPSKVRFWNTTDLSHGLDMPSDFKKCFAGFAVTITNSTNFYISHYVESFTYSRERLSEYVPGCHNPVYFPFF